jgi:hypothetical protein
MALTKTLKNWFKGWLPKDPVLQFPIKAAPVNRKIVDKKLHAGTITVSLIIVLFGAFVYSTFSQPIVYQYHTQVRYPIKEPQIEESLKPYLGVYMTRGIFNGTVDWIGVPQDPVKQLENIHIVSYACIVDRNYDQGHIWSITVEEHVVVSQDKFVLPNETIGYQEAVIPILDANTRHYVFTFDFPLTVSGLETWDAA